MMQPNPFWGVALHSIGAFSSSSCYTPQKQTKLWSWEVYWITTASFAWLILPIVGAFLTIPDYLDVLAACPKEAMLRSLGLGIIYGVGGLTFGLGIRYIGFSLNYAIAIGISAGLGTLAPIDLAPERRFCLGDMDKFSDSGHDRAWPGFLFHWPASRSAAWQACCVKEAGRDARDRYSFEIGFHWRSLPERFPPSSTLRCLPASRWKRPPSPQVQAILLKMNAIYPFSTAARLSRTSFGA